jgi:hypothetical protein
MVHCLTAREKLQVKKICVNVSVNKGEGGVKGKNTLFLKQRQRFSD